MLSCNCTLAGTNACKNCINNNNNNNNTSRYSFISQTKNIPIIQYWCPRCESVLSKYQRYCQNCAMELHWDFEIEN